MQLKKIGEFGLIEFLRKKYSLNIGDDCGIIKLSPKKYLLLTTDFFIEDIHFKRAWSSFEDIGYKALAINISDIASMGGKPLFGLIGASLPVDMSVENVDKMFKGIHRLSTEQGIRIIGGDTSLSTRGIVLSISLIGKTNGWKPVFRSGAKKGDLICTTGYLGDSKAGLDILKKGVKVKGKKLKVLVNKHLRPEPKVKEGLFLAKNSLATSMIDSSDGLYKSINLICRESKVGAKIFLDKIPISESLKSFTTAYSLLTTPYLLFGGEDYELIFTASLKNLKLIKSKLPNVKQIGEITSEKEGIIFLDEKKKVQEIRDKSFDHFARRN